MSNQIDMNKFNTLISQASDAVLCNSECRKQRETDKLKQNYLNSQTNLASAPNQVQVAQKNYITFTEGPAGYNDLLDNQLQEKAQEITDTFTEYFVSDSKEITTQIDTYEGLLINFKNVAELYLKYKKENVQLVTDLKNETNDVLTNDIIIPYSQYTKINTVGDHSFIEFYTTMLYPERYYKFEIKTIIDGYDYFITSPDFTFKAIR